MDIERAIPLALIVNELIANSTKHAFPDGQRGTVRVKLRWSDGYLTLVVADNGAGMTASTHGGIGGELVAALGKQVGAEVQTQTGDGAAVTIKVPESALQSSETASE